MEKDIKRFELVELTIPANTVGRVNFQTVPQLRNQPDQIIIIRGIKVFPITSYGNSQYTSSIPGFPAADIPKAALVLYINGEESIHYLPLAELINVNDFSSPYQEQISALADLTNVDFDKSYVQFSTASNAGVYVIPFGISYDRLVKSASGMPLQTNTPTGNWIQG